MKTIRAWEKNWRAVWPEMKRMDFHMLSNGAAIAGKRIKAANDDKYIEV